MTCPSCGLKAGDGIVECPGCGVIFAKWKARQEAVPLPKPNNGLSGGTVALVLLLTLGSVWLYAKKTIIFPVEQPEAPVAVAHLFLGPAAKVQGDVEIAVNPVTKFDGFTRRQIFDLRKSEIARHTELVGADYEPSLVFNGVEDGKPWWGLEGIYFYGPGGQAPSGPSEESRFLPNPYLLVGVREPFALDGSSPDGSANYYPRLTRLTWNSAESKARAEYDVSGYLDFTSNHGLPADKRRELEFVLYNARDLGFQYFALDHGSSKHVELNVDSGKPVKLIQFIHCGGSCGYPGGCNNMSPFSEAHLFQIPTVPAQAVLKLWKELPEDISATADMTFTVVLN